jgi:DNA repair exonuclease SbcCD ATPase subunit
MPQGSFKRFSEMTDAEIKSILESAVGIEALAQAYNKIRDKHDSIGTETTLLHRDCATLTDTMRQLLEEKKGYTEAEGQWAYGQYKELLRAHKRVVEALESVDELEDSLTHAPDSSSDIVEQAKKLRTLQRQLEDTVSKSLREAQQDVMSVQGSIRTIHHKIASLESSLKKMKRMEDTECPTCLQLIPKEHTQRLMQETEALLAGEQEVLKKEDDTYEALLEKSHELSTKQDRVQKNWDKIYALDQKISETRVAEECCRQQRTDLQKATAEVEYRRKNFYSLRQAQNASSNPFGEKIKNASKKMATVKKALNKALKKVSEAETAVKHLEFWLEGFSNKGLKSYILSAVTPYMNEQAERYSQILTDGKLQITFSTQTTLRSGDLREKFSVSVENKFGAEAYQGNSGGERARANLIINFVVSDLVASRAKNSYPQRFFDEPFESLDAEGLEAVMELLQEMTKTCGTIFVVTHQPEMQAAFSKVLHVVKDGKKSRILK